MNADYKEITSEYPLEFIPWIPAFAGMTHGAGMTLTVVTLEK